MEKFSSKVCCMQTKSLAILSVLILLLSFSTKAQNRTLGFVYSENLKGINVWRKYRIDITKEDFDDDFKVRFEVTNLKSHETFVYNATRNSRVVEDIIVAKL